ncbi:hypothetical protein G7Y89_g14317 [Cudoniella acicularis]|uniref:FAD dependent oxidoreductase domain-containing protein n=1 Tax=Cudoniella acicularis TaxID=354080 RepID=A0A8H4VU68_9HELO|nr:hypothetical protein G7Y89_g14317 [Cudoniella acicularis]
MADCIGIIGAGITGLATAYVLSTKHKVTIIARELPGDLGTSWASPWAGAVFHPQNTTNKLHQEMQKICFKFYWQLAKDDPSSGVKVYPMTEYFDNRGDDSGLWYRTMVPDYRVIPTNELPSGITFGVRYSSLAMNPEFLLPWLKKKLDARGVKFIRKEVNSVDQTRALTKANIIVNASGVGAKKLAGDDSVKPVRGQTMFVKTTFEELVMIEGSEYTYVIPRAGSGGVIMGGIKSDRLDTEVDPALKGSILERVNRITNGAFEGLDLSTVTDIVGLRPGRKGGLRVEREGDVIHAYGVEGAGYIYSFGVAEKVRSLIEAMEQKEPTPSRATSPPPSSPTSQPPTPPRRPSTPFPRSYDPNRRATTNLSPSSSSLSPANLTSRTAKPPFCCHNIQPQSAIRSTPQKHIWAFISRNSAPAAFTRGTILFDKDTVYRVPVVPATTSSNDTGSGNAGDVVCGEGDGGEGEKVITLGDMLEEAKYVIEYEKWLMGEKKGVRWFVMLPKPEADLRFPKNHPQHQPLTFAEIPSSPPTLPPSTTSPSIPFSPLNLSPSSPDSPPRAPIAQMTTPNPMITTTGGTVTRSGWDRDPDYVKWRCEEEGHGGKEGVWYLLRVLVHCSGGAGNDDGNDRGSNVVKDIVTFGMHCVFRHSALLSLDVRADDQLRIFVVSFLWCFIVVLTVDDI